MNDSELVELRRAIQELTEQLRRPRVHQTPSPSIISMFFTSLITALDNIFFYTIAVAIYCGIGWLLYMGYKYVFL